MNFGSRIEKQRAALVEKLVPFPEIQLGASGEYPNSLKSWFLIRHLSSGKELRVESLDASDFSTLSFIELLRNYVDECKRECK